MIKMNIVIKESGSARETFMFGREIGEKAGAGEVIALIGDLGCGKTVLAQGIAQGLGIEDIVGSPTFTILQEYGSGRLPFYHFDMYRIRDAAEMDDIGFDEYVYGNGLCLIEWANLIETILPPQYTRITVEKDMERGYDYRRIRIEEVYAIESNSTGQFRPGCLGSDCRR